jgi:hypothetical protein
MPGDPGTVRALADRLAGQGELLMRLASILTGLGEPTTATWDSPAGTAFAARSRTASSLLVSVGRRYAVSAVALRPLAAALAEAQHDVSSAVDERADAWPRAVSFGNRRVEAEQSADPAQRAMAAGYHRAEIEQLERVQAAERRHSGAWERFTQADRRCIAVLHQLARDGLDDSRTYDALTGLSRGAGALGSTAATVALLPLPPAKALGVVAGASDAVQVAADTTVKLAYGDGSWASIALSAGATGLGSASGVLKRGGLATNPAAAGAPTRTVRRLLRHDTGERLRLGVTGELRAAGRVEARPRTSTFRATRSPGSPTATAHWAAEQVTGRLRVLASNKWLDDLALVTGDPARSRTMMVTGLGAEATAGGLGGARVLRGVHLGAQDRDAMQARTDADEEGPGLDPRARPGGR